MVEERTSSEAERRILAVATAGELADLTDLADEERIVDSEFLRDVCLGRRASVDPRGLRICGATIDGSLDLSSCTVPFPLSFEATAFAAAPTFESARLRGLALNRSAVMGSLILRNARVDGDLRCRGATLANKGSVALVADGAEITGGVFLDGGFEATGDVRLPGARIGGQFSCERATLANEKGVALTVDQAEIIGGVFLVGGFEAKGEVRLLGARIGGELNCDGAKLANEGGAALAADGAEIAGDVFLVEGFKANGEMRLLGARIGGQLTCNRARLANEGGVALSAEELRVGGGLILRDVTVRGGLSLYEASVRTLGDDLAPASLGSWEGAKPLFLEGFSYERFAPGSESRPDVRGRWLRSTAGFQHGAWQQLISLYRAHGRDEEATRASIAMHRDRVRRAGLPWYRRVGRRVLGAVVGHGYRPWYAGLWATAVVAAFAVVVWRWAHLLEPENPERPRALAPAAFAADTFLPIIDLGQADAWFPTCWLRWVTWAVVLLGWAISTLSITGFTRIVRND
jgi:hypothetical protein